MCGTPRLPPDTAECSDVDVNTLARPLLSTEGPDQEREAHKAVHALLTGGANSTPARPSPRGCPSGHSIGAEVLCDDVLEGTKLCLL